MENWLSGELTKSKNTSLIWKRLATNVPMTIAILTIVITFMLLQVVRAAPSNQTKMYRKMRKITSFAIVALLTTISSLALSSHGYGQGLSDIDRGELRDRRDAQAKAHAKAKADNEKAERERIRDFEHEEFQRRLRPRTPSGGPTAVALEAAKIAWEAYKKAKAAREKKRHEDGARADREKAKGNIGNRPANRPIGSGERPGDARDRPFAADPDNRPYSEVISSLVGETNKCSPQEIRHIGICVGWASKWCKRREPCLRNSCKKALKCTLTN